MDGKVLVGLVILGAIVYSIVNKAGYVFQETIADTIIGDLTGTRTVDASNASKWIKSCLWLRKDYREWLLSPEFQFLSKYRLDILGAQAAEDIAKDIIDSNFKIFDNATIESMSNFILQYGLHVDNPDEPIQAISAISRIKNQVQALEVTHYYWAITGKNLSAGLQWLPDQQMVEAADWFKSLPTGAFSISSGAQLSQLPKPKM